MGGRGGRYEVPVLLEGKKGTIIIICIVMLNGHAGIPRIPRPK